MITCLLTCLSIALAATSCAEPEPRYRTEWLAFDPGLMGTWTIVPEKANDGQPAVLERIDVTFAPRTLVVSDGRTEPEPLERPKPANTGTPPPPANAVVMTIHVDSGGKLAPSFDIECKGFLLSIDGVTLLTFQPSARQVSDAHLGGLVIPVQQVVRIARDSDTTTVWFPTSRVMWLPDVTYLDASAELPDQLPELRGEKTQWITMDIDRFVDALRARLKSPDPWVEPAMRLTRVPAK